MPVLADDRLGPYQILNKITGHSANFGKAKMILC